MNLQLRNGITYMLLLSAVFFVFLVVILSNINPYLSIVSIIPILLLLYFLTKKDNLKKDHLFIFLFATCAIPHSILIGGLNISLSDVYVALLFFILPLIYTFNLKLPKTYTILFLIFFIYHFTTLGWTPNISKSIPRLLQYIEFMFMSVIILYNSSNPITIKKMLDYYLFVASIIGIIGIFYYFLYDISGPLFVLGLHKNGLGWILGSTIPIILGKIFRENNSRKIQLFFTFLLLINCFALFLTWSRGAILGVVASTIVFFIIIKKYKHIFTFSVIVTIAFFFFNLVSPSFFEQAFNFTERSSAYSRIIIFNDAKHKIDKNPIFGNGIGNYHISIPEINFSQDDPNNIFLLFLVESGFIGVSLFSLLILYIFGVAMSNIKYFKNNQELLILNGVLFSIFLSRLIHTQVDVTWVRGASLIMFSSVGLLLALTRFRNKN